MIGEGEFRLQVAGENVCEGPHENHAILSTGHKERVVVREHQMSYVLEVSCQRSEHLPGGNVPEVDELIDSTYAVVSVTGHSQGVHLARCHQPSTLELFLTVDRPNVDHRFRGIRRYDKVVIDESNRVLST